MLQGLLGKHFLGSTSGVRHTQRGVHIVRQSLRAHLKRQSLRARAIPRLQLPRPGQLSSEPACQTRKQDKDASVSSTKHEA